MSNISVTRIAKAGFKDGLFQVVQRCRSSDTERTINISCSKSRCHPDLEAAFDACGPAVREILEWPSTLYGNRLRITGVSWSHSESTDVEGACIIFQVDLEDSNSPFCGTTPHLPYEQYSESGEQPVMPDGGIDALNALKDEVERFLTGKRAQGDLFERIDEIGRENGMPPSVIEATKEEYAS